MLIRLLKFPSAPKYISQSPVVDFTISKAIISDGSVSRSQLRLVVITSVALPDVIFKSFSVSSEPV